MKSKTIELSLRPYTGRLFFAKTRKEYERQHVALFKTPDILSCAQAGRYMAGEGNDGLWTYLVFAETPNVLAHEFCHVLFHVFKRAGIKPGDSGGEAFCYMLSQLMVDASQ